MKKLTLLLITISLILTGCGIYKHSPIKDNPVNVKDRVAKNIEEGRGIRFGKWFNMVRDTSNDEIKLIYKMGERPPSE